MKKVITVVWFLILVININKGQGQKVIDNDSLLKLFHQMKPFEVFERVQFENFNFKSCYYDTSLKPYLLKWLDKLEYFNHEIAIRRETITNRPDLIKDEILYLLVPQYWAIWPQK